MRRGRDALLVGAALAIVVAVLPPVELEARRYVAFESVQFALIAIVVPALLVLGAPLQRLAGSGRSWRVLEARKGRVAPPQHQGGRARTLPLLCGYLGLVVVFRLPFVVDAIRSAPGLLGVEIVAFAIVGAALWSELVVRAPLAPRVTPIGRIALAASAMWLIWVLAYFVGFSRGPWFPAYSDTHRAISVIADQQLATGVLWAVSAAVFLPVIFTNLMRFLSDDEDLDAELRRLVRGSRRTPTN